MSKEAMKLALAALDGGHVDRAYGYIQEALAQREWVGLTDEEIDELYGSPMELEHSGALKWVRVIEAKLKEKNT